MPTGEIECYGPGDPSGSTVLICRYLQRCLAWSLDHSNQDFEHVISLDLESMEELHWWSMEMIKWNGKVLLRKDIDLWIMPDASLMDWGTTSDLQRTGGPWSQEECMMHIKCLELLAATLALKTFAKGRRGYQYGCTWTTQRQ